MIYIGIGARDHADTVGLVLWKIRRVFEEFEREYQVLVTDDGSTDETPQVLETYQHVLPVTVARHEAPRGRAASLEWILREALARSDRPRRDCLITLPADFSVSPAILPELVKRFESGADVVVAETVDNDTSPGRRLVRRCAPWLLKPGLSVPGIRDLTSGVCALRLITVKTCARDRDDTLFDTDGLCTFAELVARTAAAARQVAAVPIETPPPPFEEAGTANSWSLAVELFRAGRRLRIPTPDREVQRP